MIESSCAVFAFVMSFVIARSTKHVLAVKMAEGTHSLTSVQQTGNKKDHHAQYLSNYRLDLH